MVTVGVLVVLLVMVAAIITAVVLKRRKSKTVAEKGHHDCVYIQCAVFIFSFSANLHACMHADGEHSSQNEPEMM